MQPSYGTLWAHSENLSGIYDLEVVIQAECGDSLEMEPLWD